MQAIAKIKDILGQRPSQYIPSTLDFNEIDLDYLINSMQLKSVAQERGEREQPNTTAQELDNIETNIIHEIEAEKTRNYATLLGELRAYDQRIAALNLDNKIFEIKGSAQNAIAEFIAEVRKGELDFTPVLQHVKEIDQERIDFRDTHKLKKTANHPETPAVCWSIIAILFLVESIINSTFLANGHDGGLLGGLVEAVGIAFINVATGVAVGLLAYPFMYHIRGSCRILGAAALLAHIIFACVFNLWVAHYRLALSGDQSDLAATNAIQNFLENPTKLSDFHSWLMIGIGFIFSMGAAWDGFKMNDRYPGYSNLERRYATALHNYSQSQADIIDRLRKIKDKAIEEMRQHINDLSTRRTEFNNIVANREGLINSFEQRIYYLQNCVRNLISFYRDANIAARVSEPPAYFNDSCYIMQHPEKIETPVHLLVEQSKLEAAVGNITTELDKANEEMHAQFIEVQNFFPLLREIIVMK